jgi:glycosyltransferase involved in cell wall biosynthesis
VSAIDKTPLVSVAIPATKKQFIRTAVDSMIHQTYVNIELIIVDDSPDDDIKAIIDSFSDERVHYYTTNRKTSGKTQGPVTTWNTCLNHAQGDYFILFSDDDACDPAFIEEMVQLAIPYPEVKIFQCRFRIIDEEDNLIETSPLCPDNESGLDFILNHIQENRRIRGINYMFEREALIQLGGFIDMPVAWDSDVLTDYAMSMKGGIVSTNKLLCDWRRSRYNITETAAFEEKLKALDQRTAILNSILDDHSERSSYNSSDKRLIRLIRRSLPERIRNQKTALILAHINKTNPGRNIISKTITLKKQYQIPIYSLIKLFLKKRFTIH